MFKIFVITAKDETEILDADTLRLACTYSMKLNNKSNGLPYIVECPDGSRMTIQDQREYLSTLDECKHLRGSSIRTESGFDVTCLTCGHKWREEDKPLTEEEVVDKERFNNEQDLESRYRK